MKDLEKYNELKSDIFNCVKFCAQKELQEKGKLPSNKHNARKNWRTSMFSYFAPTIQDFKDESKRLFGEEYGIWGIYAVAIKEANTEFSKILIN